MSIYILLPIESEINNPRWDASTHKGEMIIRAESEAKARKLAVKKTVIAVAKNYTGQNTNNRLSPWASYNRLKSLVTCAVYEGDEFPLEGGGEILKPTDLNASIG